MITYSNEIESIISKVSAKIKNDYSISKRSIALLLLQEDEEIHEMVKTSEPRSYNDILLLIKDFSKNFDGNVTYEISKALQEKSQELSSKYTTQGLKRENKFSGILSQLTVNPWTGVPILLLVLYLGFYQFVGVLGAGTLVDLIETNVFDEWLLPYINDAVNSLIPWKIVADLFVNDYGIITMGIKYAVAIILPIVTAFFILFSIIEDSGYLPRVSFLMDRVFKKIGLNGRAVIPMTLGFGCDTMATMVSRTLETKRERLIATILLSLAIPCSAQLGVILGLLSTSFLGLSIWGGFMILVFLFVGYLSAKILPGEQADFFMELPPLRMPKISNVIKKTYTRVYWYFKEILPLFILASVLIWVGYLTGIFNLVIGVIEPIVNFIGLPKETAEVFLFGFFRRDYGAAGLYDLQTSGLLNLRQLVVSAVTLTLFVPCIAQFAVMVKERGTKQAIYIAAFIVPFAFLCGFLLNRLLIWFGV